MIYDNSLIIANLGIGDVTGHWPPHAPAQPRVYPMGFLSFFPVHGTSLYENNTLVSGDNKGMAAWMYESYIEPSSMLGNNSFVAGFIQCESPSALEANVGDTTPNTLGAYCELLGNPWDGQPCVASLSIRHVVIGPRTVTDVIPVEPATRDSVLTALPPLLFGISVIVAMRCTVHAFFITSFLLSFATHVVCCSVFCCRERQQTRSSLGITFHFNLFPLHILRGPGFHISDFESNRLIGQAQFEATRTVMEDSNTTADYLFVYVTKWDTCENMLRCSWLLFRWRNYPYDWSPGTVDVQMLRVGQFVILAMPGELTTMAGRRMRDALRARLIAEGVLDDRAYVMIAATLDAYINKYSELVPYLATNATGIPSSTAAPPEQTGEFNIESSARVLGPAQSGPASAGRNLQGLVLCDTLTIRRFFCKSWRCMDAYRKGLDARQAAFAVRKYKSHRRIGMTAEALAYVSNAAGAQNNLP
ncbi:Neutral/alkaline non-lysosomal ceramidase-domain-containing protein [Suillus subalutaceus]|uniref:Neutral/alkaline non-lysosomal ceramidase-domain-containing protein n=1 Tax=Suillus subalutaceus TaxID=48586 RepID=UPI001B865100|nr:Neutral/alkaline non-lysosomal ceramidase-domain-containing protein [Suillus subalutaceus]KAG1837418.1 Neutral/alkaline non-lysosomal ceramidase-domain-containing protein [Suillus subalutaceus]